MVIGRNGRLLHRRVLGLDFGTYPAVKIDLRQYDEARSKQSANAYYRQRITVNICQHMQPSGSGLKTPVTSRAQHRGSKGVAGRDSVASCLALYVVALHPASPTSCNFRHSAIDKVYCKLQCKLWPVRADKMLEYGDAMRCCATVSNFMYKGRARIQFGQAPVNPFCAIVVSAIYGIMFPTTRQKDGRTII